MEELGLLLEWLEHCTDRLKSFLFLFVYPKDVQFQVSAWKTESVPQSFKKTNQIAIVLFRYFYYY